MRHRIGKAFVYHQQADLRTQRQQGCAIMGLAIGVVRVDHHRDIGARQRGQTADLLHLPARIRQGCGVFVIGRAQHTGEAGGAQLWHQLDCGLRAGQRHHWQARAVGRRCRCQQIGHAGLCGQGFPCLGGQGGDGIGHAIDAGGQVYPILAAIGCAGLIKIAAVVAHHSPASAIAASRAAASAQARLNKARPRTRSVPCGSGAAALRKASWLIPSA